MINLNNKFLHPYFITGLMDAEASFVVQIIKSSSHRLGWVVAPSFQITLHSKDMEVLKLIKAFFNGIGNITQQNPLAVQYRVQSVQVLSLIIDHFDKHPLISKKQADYLLFKEVILMMQRKEHLTQEGLEKIVSIKASLNLGLAGPHLTKAFPNIKPVKRALVEDITISDPQWLAGFTSGEGCYSVSVLKANTTKLGETVRLRFQLTQHIRDEQLMKGLETYLDCGSVRNRKGGLIVDYRVDKFSDLTEKIIPFFYNHPVVGVKAQDFQDFCRVANLMKAKKHLTGEGIDQIKKIILGMNTKRILD